MIDGVSAQPAGIPFHPALTPHVLSSDVCVNWGAVARLVVNEREVIAARILVLGQMPQVSRVIPPNDKN